jgi:hypothetical protein
LIKLDKADLARVLAKGKTYDHKTLNSNCDIPEEAREGYGDFVESNHF